MSSKNELEEFQFLVSEQFFPGPTEGVGSKSEIVAINRGLIRGWKHDTTVSVRPNVLRAAAQPDGNSRVIKEKMECLFLAGQTKVRKRSRLSCQHGLPQKDPRRGPDALQGGEVKMEIMRRLPGLSLKLFDRSEGLALIPRSKINFCILFEKRLVTRSESQKQNPGNRARDEGII